MNPLRRLREVREAFLRTEKTKILLKGSAGSLVLRGTGTVLRLFVGILIARLLGASEYGVYAYAVTWLGLLAIPSMLGFDHILLRYVATYRASGSWASLRGLLRFSVAAGLGASVVVGASAVAVTALLAGSAADGLFVLWVTLAILPVVVIAQMRQSMLRGFDKPVLAQVPENLVYPSLLLGLAWASPLLLGRPPVAFDIALVNGAAWLGAFVLGTVFLLRSVPGRVAASPPSAGERGHWTAMVPALVFSGLAFHLLSKGDVVVLGILAESREVGIYIVASRGAETILFLYDAITLAGASLFAGIYASGDRVELQRFTTLACKAVLWGTLPVFLVLFAAAPWFLSLFGAEFIEGQDVFRVLLTTYFVSSLGGFVIIMLYMTGHQRDVAAVMGVLALVNIAGSAVLIRSMGMMGAALASGATLVLLKFTLVALLHRRTGILSLPFRPPRWLPRLQPSLPP